MDIVEIGDGSVLAYATTTTKADGDFQIDGDPATLDAARRAVVDRPWVWLRQVHGDRVCVVDASTVGDVCGTEADALVTTDLDVVLAVHTADCVPVTLIDPAGVVAVAHAGWKGLEAGILQRTVDAMVGLGARPEAMR